MPALDLMPSVHRASSRSAAAAGYPSTSRRTVRAPLARLALLAVAGALSGSTGCIDSPTPGRNAKASVEKAPVPQRATAPSHGFNDQIAWHSLDEGLDLAKTTDTPLMLVVHASWCGRCKELKPKFSDDEITELARNFVMVNVDQDAEPRSQAFGPDGTYIPRVLFLDPESGKPDTDLQNKGRSRYHYYYSPSDDLAGVMKKALARHGKS